MFHGIYVPQLSYPFICWWTSRLLPCPGFDKQCSSALGYTCLFQFWFPWCVCPVVGLLGRMEVLFYFFPIIFISWRLITLQYCSGFCHMTQQSHFWAYTLRKPELKETHVPNVHHRSTVYNSQDMEATEMSISRQMDKKVIYTQWNITQL